MRWGGGRTARAPRTQGFLEALRAHRSAQPHGATARAGSSREMAVRATHGGSPPAPQQILSLRPPTREAEKRTTRGRCLVQADRRSGACPAEAAGSRQSLRGAEVSPLWPSASAGTLSLGHAKEQDGRQHALMSSGAWRTALSRTLSQGSTRVLGEKSWRGRCQAPGPTHSPPDVTGPSWLCLGQAGSRCHRGRLARPARGRRPCLEPRSP